MPSRGMRPSRRVSPKVNLKSRKHGLPQKKEELPSSDSQLAIDEARELILNDKSGLRNRMLLMCLIAMTGSVAMLARSVNLELARRSGDKDLNYKDNLMMSIVSLLAIGVVARMTQMFYSYDVEKNVNRIVKKEKSDIIARAEKTQAAEEEARERLEAAKEKAIQKAKIEENRKLIEKQKRSERARQRKQEQLKLDAIRANVQSSMAAREVTEREVGQEQNQEVTIRFLDAMSLAREFVRGRVAEAVKYATASVAKGDNRQNKVVNADDSQKKDIFANPNTKATTKKGVAKRRRAKKPPIKLETTQVPEEKKLANNELAKSATLSESSTGSASVDESLTPLVKGAKATEVLPISTTSSLDHVNDETDESGIDTGSVRGDELSQVSKAPKSRPQELGDHLEVDISVELRKEIARLTAGYERMQEELRSLTEKLQSSGNDEENARLKSEIFKLKEQKKISNKANKDLRRKLQEYDEMSTQPFVQQDMPAIPVPIVMAPPPLIAALEPGMYQIKVIRNGKEGMMLGYNDGSNLGVTFASSDGGMLQLHHVGYEGNVPVFGDYKNGECFYASRVEERQATETLEGGAVDAVETVVEVAESTATTVESTEISDVLQGGGAVESTEIDSDKSSVDKGIWGKVPPASEVILAANNQDFPPLKKAEGKSGLAP